MPECRRVGWLAATLVALALTACRESAPARVAATPAASPVATAASAATPAALAGAAIESASSGDPAPPALSATVLQYRRDQALGIVQVKVSNDGEVPVRIDEIRLDAPGFAALEPSRPAAELDPGRRVDLPLAYGEIHCDDGGATAGEDVAVALDVGAAGGPATALRLPLPRVDVLDRVGTAECDRRALGLLATVAFGTGWELDETGADPVLRGTVGLRRGAGDDPLVLADVGSSVLFVILPVGGAPPVVALDPGTASMEAPIEVTAPRCDAHAVAESKRSFVFPVWVGVDGAAPTPTTIAVDDASRARLDELLRASCDL